MAVLVSALALSVVLTRAPPRPPVGRSAICRACAEAAEASSGAMLPPPDDLSDNALLQIVQSEMGDVEVNELVWKYLGYRRGDDGGWSVEGGGWNGDGVFPNWAKNHPVAARAGYDVPTPPDLVGVTRTYAREVDEPILRAVQALQRSVPRDHKDRLRPTLRPLGWSGYKLDGLTPNMTRRAQVASWLLYYRTELHGVPIDELRRRRAARAAAEAAAPEKQAPTGMAGQSVV